MWIDECFEWFGWWLACQLWGDDFSQFLRGHEIWNCCCSVVLISSLLIYSNWSMACLYLWLFVCPTCRGFGEEEHQGVNAHQSVPGKLVLGGKFKQVTLVTADRPAVTEVQKCMFEVLTWADLTFSRFSSVWLRDRVMAGTGLSALI